MNFLNENNTDKSFVKYQYCMHIVDYILQHLLFSCYNNSLHNHYHSQAWSV